MHSIIFIEVIMNILRFIMLFSYLIGPITFANEGLNYCNNLFSNIALDVELSPNGPHSGIKSGVGIFRAQETEKSGLTNAGVLSALSDFNITTSYLFTHQKAYLTGFNGSHEITIQEGANWWRMDAFIKSNNSPMESVQIKENGPYIVYFSYKKIGSTGIWASHFKIFSNNELAQRFIETHDFETELYP